MAVEEKELTEEQKSTEQEEVKESEEKLKDSLLGDLDLGHEEAKEKEEAEEIEEEAGEETEEESEEQEDDSEDAGEEKETIPLTKHNKTIAKLERRIDQLTKKIKQVETPRPETIDSDQEKLNKMSLDQLKAVKRQVRLEQINNKDDMSKVVQFLELEDKIDDAIKSLPGRFYAEQVSAYDAKAEEILEELEDAGIDTAQAAPTIKKLAQDIYSTYTKLQGIKEGQSMALGFAFQHYKELNKAMANRSKVSELKKANNTLKKKTGLSGSSLKGTEKSSLDRLRSKAFRGGDANDKQNLIKADPRFGIDKLIPDEYKER